MRSVIVTGGTVRLGKVIADRLAGEGWRVIRTSHRANSGADIVEDLSVRGAAESLMNKARELLGGKMPDALVNNASVFSLGEEDYMQVNYFSPVELVNLMAETSSQGAVVNILDNRILARKAITPYEIAKAKLFDFTKYSARKYLGRVRVNAVAPGPVLAPVSVSERAGITPLGRPCPNDVAMAVSFLLSANATTGCVIPVDGGQWIVD